MGINKNLFNTVKANNLEGQKYQEKAIEGFIFSSLVLLNFNRDQAFHIEIYTYILKSLDENQGKFNLESTFASPEGIKHLLRDLNAPKIEL